MQKNWRTGSLKWEEKMNKMKSMVLAAAASALLATGATAQDVTLKLHHFLPPQANVPKLILDVWADKIEADSGGSIKIDRFPAMQLGGRPPELMDRVIDGVDDIGWTVVGYTPGRYPSTEVFELPFMVEDARAASCAYWTMFEEGMADGEFKDVKILGTWVHGPGMFHTMDHDWSTIFSPPLVQRLLACPFRLWQKLCPKA